jgi:hypothetical protein
MVECNGGIVVLLLLTLNASLTAFENTFQRNPYAIQRLPKESRQDVNCTKSPYSIVCSRGETGQTAFDAAAYLRAAHGDLYHSPTDRLALCASFNSMAQVYSV